MCVCVSEVCVSCVFVRQQSITQSSDLPVAS